MLTDKGTETLKTPRLTLRKFTLSDASDMYRNWATDERVMEYVSWEPHASPDVTEKYMAQVVEDYSKPHTYYWAIEYEGSVIGSINASVGSLRSEWAELGYCLGSEFWRLGLMTEAVRAVTDFLFSEVGFNRVQILNSPQNPASGRVAEKCCFFREGVMRQRYKVKSGGFSDLNVWGMTRSDWEELKA